MNCYPSQSAQSPSPASPLVTEALQGWGGDEAPICKGGGGPFDELALRFSLVLAPIRMK